jgi:glycosyltransferase involved in cell wall biosynthesis
MLQLNDLRIGLIDIVPDSPRGALARELYLNLKDRLNIEEVYCDRVRECQKVKWALPPANIIPYYTKHLRDRQLLWKIPKYDIYHFQSLFYIALAKYRKPAIVTVHDLTPLHLKDFKNFYSKTEIKGYQRRLKLLNKVDYLIANSNYTKEEYINLLKIDPDRIEVVYLGFDPNTYKSRAKGKSREKLNLPQNKTILLNVGTENKNKNIERLIRVFYKLQRKFKNLILIRVGLTSDEISGLIDKLGLSNKVLRVGFVEEEYLSFYYNASDLYICADLLAGFGRPNLEAMASGCPVVTSQTGAFPEVVGDAGLFFDPQGEDDIFEKIVTLLDDNKLREEYAQKGLERAELFSWKKMADETIKIYEKVAREYYDK